MVCCELCSESKEPVEHQGYNIMEFVLCELPSEAEETVGCHA